MTRYTFGINNPHQQYIEISVEFETKGDSATLQLPSWRPGRYELGNFAKNINNLKVYNSKDKVIAAEKLNKDSWIIDTSKTDSINVEYKYYAIEMNAGSSFLDKDQLYVNPVNCCMYDPETYDDVVEVVLNVPEKWDVATSMKKKRSGIWNVSGIDELLDTPFIASSMLQYKTYTSKDTKFFVWFNGEVKPDWERLLKDFQAFTDCQIAKFVEFPTDEYHFINLILPYRTYHGVEHSKSTVISLGPSYEIFTDLYKELLGVSSHELYHTWNVKAIRPIEMYPYDFTKENYSKLGYLCEGVTTYQGDLFLLKSGVFTEEQYFLELNSQLQRHFDNFGRFNYSVAQSSFDTWLDGYVSGAPGRKVSIYTEGCLLAFVTDVRILKATDHKSNLDAVMKRLYFNYSLQGKGISAEDYQSEIEAITGESWKKFFKDYVNGTKSFESIIIDALEYIGLELNLNPTSSYSATRLGFKAMKSGNNFVVKAIFSGGPAENAKISLDDEIMAVNDIALDGELDKWLNYFDDDVKKVTIKRKGRIVELIFPEVTRDFYKRYTITKNPKPEKLNARAYLAWKK